MRDLIREMLGESWLEQATLDFVTLQIVVWPACAICRLDYSGELGS